MHANMPIIMPIIRNKRPSQLLCTLFLPTGCLSGLQILQRAQAATTIQKVNLVARSIRSAWEYDPQMYSGLCHVRQLQ